MGSGMFMHIMFINNGFARLDPCLGTCVRLIQLAKSGEKFSILARVQWHIPTVVPKARQVSGDHGQSRRHRFQCGIGAGFTVGSVCGNQHRV